MPKGNSRPLDRCNAAEISGKPNMKPTASWSLCRMILIKRWIGYGQDVIHNKLDLSISERVIFPVIDKRIIISPANARSPVAVIPFYS